MPHASEFSDPSPTFGDNTSSSAIRHSKQIDNKQRNGLSKIQFYRRQNVHCFCVSERRLCHSTWMRLETTFWTHIFNGNRLHHITFCYSVHSLPFTFFVWQPQNKKLRLSHKYVLKWREWIARWVVSEFFIANVFLRAPFRQRVYDHDVILRRIQSKNKTNYTTRPSNKNAFFSPDRIDELCK